MRARAHTAPSTRSISPTASIGATLGGANSSVVRHERLVDLLLAAVRRWPGRRTDCGIDRVSGPSHPAEGSALRRQAHHGRGLEAAPRAHARYRASHFL